MKADAQVHGELPSDTAGDGDNTDAARKVNCSFLSSISASTCILMQQVTYAALGLFGWLALTENREDADNVSDTTHTVQSSSVRNTILTSIYLRVFLGAPLLIYQAYALLERNHVSQIAKTAANSNHGGAGKGKGTKKAAITFAGTVRNGNEHSECCQTFTMRLFTFSQFIYGFSDILQAHVSDYGGPVETNSIAINANSTRGFDGHGETHKYSARSMISFMLLSHYLFFYLLLSTGNGIRTSSTVAGCDMSDYQGKDPFSNSVGMVWEFTRRIGVVGLLIALCYITYVAIWLVLNSSNINWLEMEWKLPTSIGLMYIFTSLTFR